MTTGQKIAKCRKDRGLTQESLAGVLGVSRQAVSRWESDIAFPETDNLTKLSKLFGVTVDWLLNYDSETEGAGIAQYRARCGTRSGGFSIKDFYIEYKSKAYIGKLPLVHVNIGFGRRANGIISVGLISTGIISVGLISAGVLSLGLLSLGLISFGILALGAFAAGSFAIGIIALGAVTLGLFAMGAINFGLFSVGALSYGHFIAIGDIARGGIALGNQSAEGSIFAATVPQFGELKEQIYWHFGNIPKIFAPFTAWCRAVFEGVLNSKITLGG